MTEKQFEENSRTWYLGAHLEARSNDDVAFVRELYEQRIKDLEEYIKIIKNVGQSQ